MLSAPSGSSWAHKCSEASSPTTSESSARRRRSSPCTRSSRPSLCGAVNTTKRPEIPGELEAISATMSCIVLSSCSGSSIDANTSCTAWRKSRTSLLFGGGRLSLPAGAASAGESSDKLADGTETRSPASFACLLPSGATSSWLLPFDECHRN